jgi:elongation factor P hydroxylase
VNKGAHGNRIGTPVISIFGLAVYNSRRILSPDRIESLSHHPLPPEHWETGVQALLNCLNPWLQATHQTTLVAAEYEPFYAPKSEEQAFHEIQFAHGYFNSALHELAHWCVAGEARRLLPDFGYWYEPDGRSAEQQRQFEQVEVKPQAIEWHFTAATGRKFRVSVDNLSGEATDSKPFELAVQKQALAFQIEGLPRRAMQIVSRLSECFGVGPLQAKDFALDESDHVLG